MDNEIISKWLGECRHKGVYNRNSDLIECECGAKCKEGMQWHMHLESAVGRGASESKVLTRLDYDKNPASWTPELFDRIEEAGLMDTFTGILMEIVTGEQYGRPDWSDVWECIRSTPMQKSAALSRAIREVEG